MPESQGGAGQLLRRLSLTQFRNYAALVWTPRARISVLWGPNGSGKTNLLEAISLLVPGRGLRGARIASLARRGEGAGAAWAVVQSDLFRSACYRRKLANRSGFC